jgi:hypothetical protein
MRYYTLKSSDTMLSLTDHLKLDSDQRLKFFKWMHNKFSFDDRIQIDIFEDGVEILGKMAHHRRWERIDRMCGSVTEREADILKLEVVDDLYTEFKNFECNQIAENKERWM